jgi:putative membrane protein
VERRLLLDNENNRRQYWDQQGRRSGRTSFDRATGRAGASDAGDAHRAAAVVTGVDIDGWKALLPAAAIFMISRAVLRPLLILLTCPLELLTLGLFTIVINAAVFGFTAWFSGKVRVGFHVDGFWAALFGSLIVSGVYFVASLVIRGQRREWLWRRRTMDDRDRWV